MSPRLLYACGLRAPLVACLGAIALVDADGVLGAEQDRLAVRSSDRSEGTSFSGGAASGPTFSLKWLYPTGALRYPPGTKGVGTSKLTLPDVPPERQALWLGVYISGWDVPPTGELREWQATLDSAALPAGLSVYRFDCAGDDDERCVYYLGDGQSAGCNIPPITDDTCSPAFINENAPGHEHFGIESCSIGSDDLSCRGEIDTEADEDAHPDPGEERYVATFVLRVTEEFVGQYGGGTSIDLISADDQTYMVDGWGITLAVETIAADLLLAPIGSCCYDFFGSDPAQCVDGVTASQCAALPSPNYFREGEPCPEEGGFACCECIEDSVCSDPVLGVTSDDRCTRNICDICFCAFPTVADWDVGECCDPFNGEVTSTDDGDECRADVCSLGVREDGRGHGEPVGSVVAPEGTLCDDGNPCTFGDWCTGLSTSAEGGCRGIDINPYDCQSDSDCEALIPGTQCDPVTERCFCMNARNRTVAFRTPEAPTVAGGSQTAWRLTLTRLYDTALGCAPRSEQPDLSAYEGEVRWIGPPTEYAEDSVPPAPNFLAGTTQCCPHFRDWSGDALALDFDGDGPGLTGRGIDGSANVDMVHIIGAEVVPCSTYALQQVDAGCPDLSDEGCYTAPLVLRTALWGDVWEPLGVVSFIDIGKVVQTFKSIGYDPGPPKRGGPPKVVAMLRGNVPPLDRKVDFIDIGKDVEAFKQLPYKEAGPATHCEDPCP